MDADDPEFRDWAAKRLAEIAELEAKERLVEDSPPDDLKELFYLLESEVAPILDASGFHMTRDELLKIFAEWFVKREATSARAAQSASPPPTRAGWRRFEAPLKRGFRFVGIIIMLLPLVIVPSYYFIATEMPPPLASGVMTLSPAVPLIAPGQIQNYSLLTLTQPTSASESTTFTTFSPEGLSLSISTNEFPAQQSTIIPVTIRASALIAPGNYSVTVEEMEGSAAKKQTFTVAVVPAFVVMEHFAFVPENLNVTRGTTVYWMNLDSTTGCCDPGYHDVFFRGGVNVTSPILKRLDAWSFAFESPGSYFYYCSIHPYMVGVVAVTA